MQRNSKKNTEYTITVAVILLLLIPLSIFLVPGLEKARIRQSNEDLREISRALEELFIDNSTYPYTDEFYKTGERITYNSHNGYTPEDYEEIVKQVYLMPPRYTSGVWPNYFPYNRYNLRNYGVLTTPITYLAKIPVDPFSQNGNRHYRYGLSPIGWPWILAGNGPDGDEDIDVNRFCLDNGRLIMPNTYDNIYYGYDKPLVEYMHDPTNGLKSNGDIIRIKQ